MITAKYSNERPIVLSFYGQFKADLKACTVTMFVTKLYMKEDEKMLKVPEVNRIYLL